MSINMLQTMTGKKVSKKPAGFAQKNGKTEKGKTDKDFLKMLGDVLTLQSQKEAGSKAPVRGTGLSKAQMRSKVTNLFLKLKKLAKELNENPDLDVEAKDDLVLRLGLTKEFEELKKLPAGQTMQLISWLRAVVANPGELVETKGDGGITGVKQETPVPLQGESAVKTAKPVSRHSIRGGDSLSSGKSDQAFRHEPVGQDKPGQNSQAQGLDQVVLKTMEELLSGKEESRPAEHLSAALKKLSGKKVKQAKKAEVFKSETPAASDEPQQSTAKDTAESAKLNEASYLNLLKQLQQKKTAKQAPGLNGKLSSVSTKPALAAADKKGDAAAKQPMVLKGLKFELRESGNLKQAQAPKSPARQTGPADPYKVVDQVVQKVKLQIAPGVSRLEMQLEPKHLGKIQVRLVMENNQLTARLTTASASVQDILQQNLHQLKQALQSQGVVVESLNVNLGTGSRQHHSASPEGNAKSSAGNGGRLVSLEGHEEEQGHAAFQPRQMMGNSHINYLI